MLLKIAKKFLSFHTYIILLVKRMTCRGEFSFIIAAFALSEGVTKDVCCCCLGSAFVSYYESLYSTECDRIF